MIWSLLLSAISLVALLVILVTAAIVLLIWNGKNKKRLRRLAFLALGLAGVTIIGIGLFTFYNLSHPAVRFALYSLSRPADSCAIAPRKPASAPPGSLTSAQDYLHLGDVDYDLGNCDQAIRDYTQAIALNPKYAEAYNNRAYVNMIKQDYAAALPDLDQAIQLRPNYVNALMNRGDIYNYYYSIDYTRAVADYDRVLSIDPYAPVHTSVCGHRLLATTHGWHLSTLIELLRHGARAGCPPAAGSQ